MVGTEKESLPVMNKKEVEDEEGGLDGFDDEDFEDFETLPCNLKYVVICLILPSLNGLLNGFLWPAYTLHFLNNGWPVVRAGLAQALGFSCRVLTQQMQLAAGYWLIVPLAVIHLTFAVLGFIYFDQEWAVFAEILVVFTIDPTCAIEGLAFDTFVNSESQARQASSTVLSVYTIGNALACTIGGLAFDFYGWRGIAALHTICQSALLFMLAIQPSMRQSFMEACFAAKEPEKMEKDQVESSARASKIDVDSVANGAFLAVLPGAVEEHNPPDAAGDLVVEEVGQGVDPDSHGQPGMRSSNLSRVHGQLEMIHDMRNSNVSRGSRLSRRTDGTHARTTERSRRTARSGRATLSSLKVGTGGTARSVLSALSRVSAYHFGTNLATRPHIVGRTGAKRVLRDEVGDFEEGNKVEESIPRPLKLWLAQRFQKISGFQYWWSCWTASPTQPHMSSSTPLLHFSSGKCTAGMKQLWQVWPRQLAMWWLQSWCRWFPFWCQVAMIQVKRAHVVDSGTAWHRNLTLSLAFWSHGWSWMPAWLAHGCL